MKDVRHRRAAMVGLGLALAGSGVALGAFPVVAQEAPTASADYECGDEGAIIQVSIVDDFSTTYNVYIDDVLVDEEVTDTDDGTYDYGPYADGVHNVRVHWISGEDDILDEDLTVACAPVETTPTVPTTPTTAPPAAAPAVVAPTYTG